MKFFARLVDFAPMFFIGRPLFFFLSKHSYFPIEEKYMPIRPTDVFVYMNLCGWATVCSILATVTILILTNVLVACTGFLVVSLFALYLIRVIGKLFLDFALKCALTEKQN